MKAGQKIEDASGTAAIVVKPPTDGAAVSFSDGDAVLLGKRYTCADEGCGAELIITKGGDNTLVCHGAPMDVAQPKTLPSSD
jgi:hypothetical protein